MQHPGQRQAKSELVRCAQRARPVRVRVLRRRQRQPAPRPGHGLPAHHARVADCGRVPSGQRQECAQELYLPAPVSADLPVHRYAVYVLQGHPEPRHRFRASLPVSLLSGQHQPWLSPSTRPRQALVPDRAASDCSCSSIYSRNPPFLRGCPRTSVWFVTGTGREGRASSPLASLACRHDAVTTALRSVHRYSRLDQW